MTPSTSVPTLPTSFCDMDESEVLPVEDVSPNCGDGVRQFGIAGGSVISSGGGNDGSVSNDPRGQPELARAAGGLNRSVSNAARGQPEQALVRVGSQQAWGPSQTTSPSTVEANVINVGFKGGEARRGPEGVPSINDVGVGADARLAQNTQPQLPIKLSRMSQSEQAATRMAVRLGKADAWSTQLNELKVIHDQCTRRQRAYYKQQQQTTWIYHTNAFITLTLILSCGALALSSDSIDDAGGEGTAGTTGAILAFVAGLCFYLDKYLQWGQKMERYGTAAARSVALLSDLENAILNFCTRIASVTDAGATTVEEELNLAARDCDRYRGALKAIELEYPLTYDGSYLPEEV